MAPAHHCQLSSRRNHHDPKAMSVHSRHGRPYRCRRRAGHLQASLAGGINERDRAHTASPVSSAARRLTTVRAVRLGEAPPV